MEGGEEKGRLQGSRFTAHTGKAKAHLLVEASRLS